MKVINILFIYILFNAGPGVCEGVKQEAMKFMEEAEQLILASNGSQFAFGESFLLAKGVQLTDRDLLRSAGPDGLEAVISQKLLSGSDSALQLAAWSGGWEGEESLIKWSHAQNLCKRT